MPSQSQQGPSRRSVVVGAVATGVGWAAAPPAAANSSPGTAATPSAADTVIVGRGLTAHALAAWGTPLWADDAARRDDAAGQVRQVGTHHSGLHFAPLAAVGQGLLVISHEYVDERLLCPGGTHAGEAGQHLAKALAAIGVSVVQVCHNGKGWQTVPSRRNWRITGSTPVTFSGPVSADHPAVWAPYPARGVLGASFSGTTPWGTYLACEENFNRFFGTDDASWAPDELQRRYALNAFGYGHRWHRADDRFDLAVHPGEPNRHGWVVEVDPLRPNSSPIKRTALGRFKHAGATVVETHGRVVVYSGDDENGGYLYKFVSRAPWRNLRRQSRSPLDEGTLCVAQFEANGSGRWLPLVHGQGPLVRRNGWRDQADVLLRARQAADALRATPLDRPQQAAVHPRTRHGYLALANGAGNGACGSDPMPRTASPAAGNRHGHILRWQESGNDPTAHTFWWEIFATGGERFSAPKGLSFDRVGRLWIATGHCTDTAPQLGTNALLVTDPATGALTRVATGPRGAELSGIAHTPDGKGVFVNVQHPGESGGQAPATPSAWPGRAPAGRPRSAVVALAPRDGSALVAG
ncbi:PhoX family protein [Streptomyces sp. NPDC058572]|uniref:PhoX family protein n=1 Tax=Streptomyces sp. NPDC058572 TaxID=3346546 RepID=UPI003649028D